MKTMQEVQTLISDLQQFYTDVRLLDATAIERIEEGVRSNPKAVLCLPPQKPPLPPLRGEECVREP